MSNNILVYNIPITPQISMMYQPHYFKTQHAELNNFARRDTVHCTENRELVIGIYGNRIYHIQNEAIVVIGYVKKHFYKYISRDVIKIIIAFCCIPDRTHSQ